MKLTLSTPNRTDHSFASLAYAVWQTGIIQDFNERVFLILHLSFPLALDGMLILMLNMITLP